MRALQLIPDDLDPGPSAGCAGERARAGGRGRVAAVPPTMGSSGVPLDASLLAIAERLRTRELSPVELCEHCLARAAERAQPWNAFRGCSRIGHERGEARRGGNREPGAGAGRSMAYPWR
jgi:hypothetical protein